MQITIFSKLYAAALRWSQHRHAPYYLGAVSFAESSFFPIPPDVMLLPMCIANRTKAWWYALLTTLTSVAGAALGYLLGILLAQTAVDVLISMHLVSQADFEAFKTLYADYGLWVIFMAGFTLIPYKIFTITSGIFGIAFLPFLLMSLLARGARYGVVAAAGYFGGPIIERHFMKYFDRIGLISVLLLFIAWLAYRML